MRHELYVLWLVRTSERARGVVEEALGTFSESDLVRKLSGPELAEVDYADLAARIHVEFDPPRLPSVLTDRELKALVEPRSRSLLADVFGCAPSDAIAVLFDADQLTRVLRTVGSASQLSGDVESLLLDLLARLPRVAARYNLEPRDWGRFIERRHWLTPTAVNRLTDTARRWEWPTATPTQILAGILAGTTTRRDADLAARYDALALIELRRRIGLLAEQLRTDALEHAEEAARLTPDLGVVSRLPAWLELYELNAPAIGMRRLFTGATSVGALLRGAHGDPPPVSGQPKPDEPLQVTNEIAFGVFRRRIAFDITCAVEEQPHPVVILRCRGLRGTEYETVRDAIHRLRGSDLAPTGTTLGEQLLNTEVAQHQGLRGHLRLALEQHGAVATQCVVLTGTRQPVPVTAPWHEHLVTQLPFDSPPSGDTGFPTLDEINASARRGVRAGRHIQQVT